MLNRTKAYQYVIGAPSKLYVMLEYGVRLRAVSNSKEYNFETRKAFTIECKNEGAVAKLNIKYYLFDELVFI